MQYHFNNVKLYNVLSILKIKIKYGHTEAAHHELFEDQVGIYRDKRCHPDSQTKSKIRPYIHNLISQQQPLT